MEEKFLKTWEETINKLVREGIINPEDLEEGIDILPDWLYSSILDRKSMMWAMRDLYVQQFPQQPKYKLKEFFKFATMKYINKDEKPIIEVKIKNDYITVSDEEIQPTRKYERTINSEKLIEALISVEKEMKEYEIRESDEFSSMEHLVGKPALRGLAKVAVEKFFNERQIKIEEHAINQGLSEMALNFGEYYKWMVQEEQEIQKLEEEKKNKSIEIYGGLIQPVVNDKGQGSGGGVISGERISDISSFEERDKFLRGLSPIKIINFSAINEEGKIVKNAYTCYIYQNPQEKDGYLVISEPLQGDKETRTFFANNEYVKEMMVGYDDENGFWPDFIKAYIADMTRTEFADEDNTYTFYHRGEFDDYTKKIEQVINGIDKSKDQKSQRNAKRAATRLFKQPELTEMVGGVKISGVKEAESEVFGDKDKANDKENKGEEIDEN